MSVRIPLFSCSDRDWQADLTCRASLPQMASTPLNTSGTSIFDFQKHGNVPSARTFTPRPISPLLIAHTQEEMDDLASSRSARVEVIKCLRNRSEVLDHIPTYQAQSYHRGTLNTPKFHSIRSVCFEVGGTSGTAPRSGTIHHSLSFRGWTKSKQDIPNTKAH
ncbi:hypothetical protein DY000_02042067 [Brassica cretica]|uniref:Uncharacterized protein n=1 Tax=Brassica cretica TaxID=69181 RepID=A0ABQ7BLG0_BRACR|nr:hypothetical protein DY000_02042067 [Brassica cretica]